MKTSTIELKNPPDRHRTAGIVRPVRASEDD